MSNEQLSVRNIQILNNKIENINKERIKVETQMRMLKDQIFKDLKDYSSKYGVDLSGDSLAEISKNISSEAKRVRAEVNAEYELKEKIVSLIESGNIDEANKLLGIGVDSGAAGGDEEVSEVEEVVKEAVGKAEEVGRPATAETTTSKVAKSNIMMSGAATEPIGKGIADVAEEVDFGIDLDEVDGEDVEEPTDVGSGVVNPFGNFNIYAEDEPEEPVQEPVKKPVKAPTTTKSEPKNEPKKEKSNDIFSSFNISGLDLDTDEDEVEDPFGFGSMLNGGKL